MKRALVVLAMLFAVTGSLAGGANAAGRTATGTERLQSLEQGLLAEVNAVRTAHGLRTLTLSDELRGAAVAHSYAMLEKGFFEHESHDGTQFSERVKRFYRAAGYSSWSAGENLLYSTAEIDARAAIAAWLESPSHRANMLAPNWREVGIGAVSAASAGGTFGGEPTWVITMDFGTRAGGPDPAHLVTLEAVKGRADAAKARAAAKAKAARAKAARARAARAKAAKEKAARDQANRPVAPKIAPAAPSTGMTTPPPGGDAASSEEELDDDPGDLDLVGRFFEDGGGADPPAEPSLEQ